MNPVALMAVQGGMNIMGNLFSGYANAANLERDARAAEFNAGLYIQNAARTRLEAGLNEEASRRASRRVLGEQRAMLIESGGSITGSAADVIRQSSIDAELDALSIRYEGDQAARSLEMDAIFARHDAAISRASAKGARRAALIGAGASAIGTASQYSQYKENRRYQGEQLRLVRNQNYYIRDRGGL